MAVQHGPSAVNREAVAWALVGILAAGFLALEVMLLTLLVGVAEDMDTRLDVLECQPLRTSPPIERGGDVSYSGLLGLERADQVREDAGSDGRGRLWKEQPVQSQ